MSSLEKQLALVALLQSVAKNLTDAGASLQKMSEMFIPIPVPPPKPIPKFRLGVNLAGIADWSTEMIFRDPFRTSRPWTSQQEGKPYGGGPPLVLDKNGWPTMLGGSDCFAETFVYFGIDGHVPDGPYSLLWDGDGEIELNGMAIGRYTESGKTIPMNKVGSFLAIRIRRTNVDNYVRNIRLVKTSLVGLPDTFLPSFLGYYKTSGFQVLRFMDWTNTNASKQTTWDSRVIGADASFGWGKGLPWELVIEAANKIGVDPWICLPHMASNDYAASLGQLFTKNLDSSRRVIIEYSNECWNDTMEQAKWFKAKAGVGGYEQQIRLYSVRAVELFTMFNQTFPRDHTTRVLSAHHKDIRTGAWALANNDAWRDVDAVAIAPYWGHGDQVLAKTGPNPTVVKVIDACAVLMEENRQYTSAFAQLTKDRGLELMAYESGQHLVAPDKGNKKVVDLFIQSNRDPGMEPLYIRDMENWKALGGGLYCLFSSVGKYTEHGSWGLSEYSDVTDTPKLRAVDKIVRSLIVEAKK